MAKSRIASRVAGSGLGIGAFALLSLLAGWTFGADWGWAMFSALLLLMLGYHLRHLRALGLWLERGEAPEAPRALGVWDDIHALLHRSRRESARREAELAESLARWLAAVRALPDGGGVLGGEGLGGWKGNARP